MKSINYLRILTLTIMCVLASYQASWAADADFSWLPNDASDGTVGYILHCGTSSREYTESIDVGSPNPVSGRVIASASQLVPGQKYFFTVTAYNAEGQESSYANEVVCTIPSDAVDDETGDTGGYDILVTSSSNLSGAVALDGATVEGEIYVFTGPDTGVNRVIFSVDGVVTQTEKAAPYELVGGSAFDTSKLSPGQHEITAKIELSNGESELVRSVFTIPSADQDKGTGTENGLYNLLVSTSSNLSGAVALDGAIVEGDIHVFTGPDTGVKQVIFSVDGVVTRTETGAPYELTGGSSAFDTSKLSPGEHEITAKIEKSDGSIELVSATFFISNANSLYDILVSDSRYLSGAVRLDGKEVGGDMYVFTSPDVGVSSVIFSIDGVVTQTETKAPFELVGGAAFNPSQLSKGTHQMTASIVLQDGSKEVIGASFVVK